MNIPTIVPSMAGSFVRVNIESVTLDFKNVTTAMEGTEPELFEIIFKKWFEQYFDQNRAAFIEDVKTTILIRNQQVITEGKVLRLTYDQTLDFLLLHQSIQPDDLVKLPFHYSNATHALASDLSSKIGAFCFLIVPLDLPLVPIQASSSSASPTSGPTTSEVAAKVMKNKNNGVLIGVVAGGAVGGIFILTLMGFMVWKCRNFNLEKI
jgi:hypothetical protein